jgi:transport inhibitor response 1
VPKGLLTCRNLAELELQENDIEFRSGAWLTGFPETYTSLVSLNFATVRSKVNYVDIVALEHLVARCPLLKTLKLNKEITPDQLQRLLQRSPNLVELGTGSYSQNLSWAQLQELQMALGKCKNLRSLSGIWEVVPLFVRTLYPVCPNLTSLNLSDVFLPTTDFARLISYCHKLQRLLVQDDVGDKGLLAASTSCKELRELRVFPVGEEGCATEEGLIAISEGCPDLRKILYFCKQMTNAAMVTFARNCVRMTHFRLCILKVYETDHVTKEPLDEGFGAICRQCKDLKRLALSGLLTDKTFEYIGQYAKNLETLSVAFAGDSYLGMQYILGGCTKLRKLEIRDCPFGDEGLLAGIHKYEAMRSLWMSTCRVTLLGCQFLAEKNRLLNVEIINECETCEQYVEKLYVYRTIAGRRNDAPPCVETL